MQTGPAVYARNLWEAFRDDPDLDFHLIVPEAKESHPKLHTVGTFAGSTRQYSELGKAALRLAHSFGHPPILHANAAHSMESIRMYSGPLLVQVNDYEAASAWRALPRNLAFVGMRRACVLCWRNAQERKVLPQAALVICNSEFTRDCVQRAYGIAAEQTRVVYKAVRLDEFRPPAELPPDPLPDRPKSHRLIFAGVDWKRKGLDLLLRALVRVRKHDPATLAVAGCPDSATRRYFRRLSNKLRLEEAVYFVGKLDRDMLRRHYWHADMLVLPSRQEALGIVLLEAAAAGLPIVTTNVGGIPELTEHLPSVFSCAPRVESIAQAIRRGLAVGSQPVALPSEFVSKFHVSRLIGEVRKVYREILATQPAAKTIS